MCAQDKIFDHTGTGLHVPSLQIAVEQAHLVELLTFVALLCDKLVGFLSSRNLTGGSSRHGWL